jgi:hypothetical protein
MVSSFVSSLGTTLQATEKLARAVGRGFNPGISRTELRGPSGPEVRFWGLSFDSRPFSAACLAVQQMSQDKRGLQNLSVNERGMLRRVGQRRRCHSRRCQFTDKFLTTEFCFLLFLPQNPFFPQPVYPPRQALPALRSKSAHNHGGALHIITLNRRTITL